MHLIRRAAPLLLSGIVLAGCVSGGLGAAGVPASDSGAGNPRPVVVAVIDGGIDPYHVAFQAGPATLVDAHLDQIPDVKAITLSAAGSYEERRAADEDIWQGLEMRQLYAFSGTRVLGISLAERPGYDPLFDITRHGTATASMVARESPSALIVMVQVDSAFCRMEPGQSCPIFPDIALGMRWAAEQPWIDVISVSLGMPVNVPVHSAEHPQVAAYLEASALAHARGKLVLSAAGNTPTPAPFDYFSGPPWVISVGGFIPQRQGDSLWAARVVDIVANYTDVVAVAGTLDEYRWNAGTSFSAPIVAGILAESMSRVLHATATAEGQARFPPPSDYRMVLNATATYADPTAWEPNEPVMGDPLQDTLRPTAPIAYGPGQIGWGYVDGRLVDEIAARVLAGDVAPPEAKREAAEHQARVQALREAYWDVAG